MFSTWNYQYELDGFYQWAPHVNYDIPRCTHDIPPMYWTSPDVLNTLYGVILPDRGLQTENLI